MARSSNPSPDRRATSTGSPLRTSGSPPVIRSAVTPRLRATRATRVISSNVRSSLPRQEGEPLLGHAVDAAQVAAIGDRDAKVVVHAPVAVDEWPLHRHGRCRILLAAPVGPHRDGDRDGSRHGTSVTASEAGTRSRIVDLMGAEGPVRSTAPGLALPDGDCVLEGVDAELRSRERLGTMWCRRHHDDGHLSHLEPTDPVEEHQAADLLPSLPGGNGHPGEPRVPLVRRTPRIPGPSPRDDPRSGRGRCRRR